MVTKEINALSLYTELALINERDQIVTFKINGGCFTRKKNNFKGKWTANMGCWRFTNSLLHVFFI